MRKFLGLLVVILLSIAVALGIKYFPGYILIQVRDYSVATPLWLGITSVILGLLALYIIVRLLYSFLSIPQGIRALSKQHRHQKQMQHLQQALSYFLVKDWALAEAHFYKLSRLNFLNQLVLLMAAQCAGLRDDSSQRIDYIHRAMQKEHRTGDQLLPNLAVIDQMISEQQWDAAKAKLDHWISLFPKDSGLLERYFEVNQALGHWHELAVKLGQLKRDRHIPSDRKIALQQKTYQGLLRSESMKGTDALKACWQSIPSKVRYSGALMQELSVLGHRLKLGDFVAAELLKGLSKQDDDALLWLLAEEHAIDPAVKLKKAESWLHAHPVTALNQYAMALICQDNQLLDRAMHYLNSSIQQLESAEAFTMLANVHWQQQNAAKAVEYYQQAIACTESLKSHKNI